MTAVCAFRPAGVDEADIPIAKEDVEVGNKTPNAMSSPVKGGDGDYKPLAASPAARNSPAVQTNLSILKTGG